MLSKLLIPLLLLVSLMPYAEGSKVDITSATHPVPLTISGTLSPFAVAMNGKELKSRDSAVSKLKINGTAIQTSPDPTGSFYLKTELNELHIDIENPDGHSERITDFSLPSLSKLELNRGRIDFYVAGPFKSLTFDRHELAIDHGHAYLTHPPEESWFQEPHVIEIQGTAGQGRIYNLDPSSWADAALSDHYVSAGFQDSKNGSGNGIGAYLGKTWASRWNTEIGLAYSHHTDLNQFGTFDEKGFSLLLRGGKQPFLPGNFWLDFRRLTLGLFSAFTRDSKAQSHPDGTTNDSSAFQFVAGPYLRLEPVLVKSFGLVFYIDANLIRPFTYDSMGNSILLSYHW